MCCRAPPGVDTGMCRGLPWSTGINRDMPGRDSEILKLPGSAGVHPGGRLYRALPCRHSVGAGICRVYAGVYHIDAGMYRISISATIPFLSGCTKLAVDLFMDLVETTIFLPDIFSSFLIFSGFSSMFMC